MIFSSGNDVVVNIWAKGITIHGKVEQWNQKEIIIHEKNTDKKWNFSYNDYLNGRIKISLKKLLS